MQVNELASNITLFDLNIVLMLTDSSKDSSEFETHLNNFGWEESTHILSEPVAPPTDVFLNGHRSNELVSLTFGFLRFFPTMLVFQRQSLFLDDFLAWECVRLQALIQVDMWSFPSVFVGLLPPR